MEYVDCVDVASTQSMHSEIYYEERPNLFEKG